MLHPRRHWYREFSSRG